MSSTTQAVVEATTLGRFAEFATRVDVKCLPADVVAKAKLCLIDALSACLTIGDKAETNFALALAKSYAASGPAGIFGTSLSTSAPLAAFVNGTTAASTARSDTHARTSSHPGSAIVPALMAMAQTRHCAGTSVIEAMVAGYEVTCRLGVAVITPSLAAVFRPTGLICPTGAAIAAGRVIGLDAAQLLHAAGLATHTASGLNEWGHCGTSEHVFHSGWAARNGVEGALLAEAGASCARTILEGRSGLLAGYGAVDRAGMMTDGLGEGFQILDIVHKPAPACMYVQVPSQIAQHLVRSDALQPADIDRIKIFVTHAAAAYPGCDDSGPIRFAQAAKMSIQFAVASVMVHGSIGDRNWLDFANPQVNALAAKCIVEVDPSLALQSSANMASRVEIALANGQVLRGGQIDMEPMNEAELTLRFMRAAEPKLGKARSEQAIELISRLERLHDIAELGVCLQPVTTP